MMIGGQGDTNKDILAPSPNLHTSHTPWNRPNMKLKEEQTDNEEKAI